MFHPRRAWLFVLLSAFAFAAAMRLAGALEALRLSSKADPDFTQAQQP